MGPPSFGTMTKCNFGTNMEKDYIKHRVSFSFFFFSFILFYFILFYFILFYFILFHFILFFTFLFQSLFYFNLFFISFYFILFLFISFYFIISFILSFSFFSLVVCLFCGYLLLLQQVEQTLVPIHSCCLLSNSGQNENRHTAHRF